MSDILPRILFFTSVSVGISVFICQLADSFFNYNLDRKMPLFVFAFLSAISFRNIAYFEDLDNDLLMMDPINLMVMYIPVFMLRSAYTIELMAGGGILSVSLISSAVPVISGGALAHIIFPIMNKSSMVCELWIFAVMFATTQPNFIIHLLKNTEKQLWSGNVINSQNLLTTTWMLLTFRILNDCNFDLCAGWGCFILVARMILGSIFLGLFICFLVTALLYNCRFDYKTTLLLLLCVSTISCYIAFLLDVSWFITPVFICCPIINNRTKLLEDDSRLIQYTIKFIFEIMDCAFYYYCVLCLCLLMGRFSYESSHYYFIAYLTLVIIRFLLSMATYPLLKRLNDDVHYKSLALLCCAGSVGNFTFFLIFFLYCLGKESYAQLVTPFVLTNAFLTLLINYNVIPCMLKRISMDALSESRIQSAKYLLQNIMDERDKFIEYLKLNSDFRYMTDVNWISIRECTTLKLIAPYPPNMTINRDQIKKKELIDMKKMHGSKRSCRLRVMRQLKIALMRRRECGFASAECTSLLIKLLNTRIQSEDGEMELKALEKYFKTNKILIKLWPCHVKLFQEVDNIDPVQLNSLQRFCYLVATDMGFRFIYISIMMLFIGVNCSEIYRTLTFAETTLFFAVVHALFLVLFVLESFLFMTAYGIAAFRRWWHTVDAIVLFLQIIKVIAIYLYLSDHIAIDSYIISSSMLHFNFIKIIRIIQALSNAMFLMETQIDANLAYAFEVAKTLSECYEEVILTVEYRERLENHRDQLLQILHEDKQATEQILLSILWQYPYIATCINTKHIIQSCRAMMVEVLNQLKRSGFLDIVEYDLVLEKIKRRNSFLEYKILPVSKEGYFQGVYWMKHCHAFLCGHGTVKTYERGDEVINEGGYLKGTLIITSGILRLKYVPNEEVIKQLVENGCIPVMEYFSTLNFDRAVEHFLIPGNVIGVKSIVLSKPFNCSIIAETDAVGYFVHEKFVRKAMEKYKDPVAGVECMMWKADAIQLATAILMVTAANRNLSKLDIQLKIERAFVPNIICYDIFTMIDLIEDVILLEGIAVDYYAKDVFIAPCYIPRSVTKLKLPKYSFVNKEVLLNTRLLIIPSEESDKYEIMSKEVEVSKLVFHEQATFCPLHQMEKPFKGHIPVSFTVGCKIFRYFAFDEELHITNKTNAQTTFKKMFI